MIVRFPLSYANTPPPGGGRISVLLVCPLLLGEGLRLTVEQDDDMTVVGLAESAREAWDLARHRDVDVVVVGWGWSEAECIDVLKRLGTGDPPPAVLALSANAEPSYVHRAVEAGARGVLPADAHSDDLIYAIRSVAHGDQLILHRTLAPAFLSSAASRAAATPSERRFESLTPREQEVVRLLARGFNDKDLAQSLSISVRTVQTHLSHIYQKLGVHTRIEVALMAVREGWAPRPSGTHKIGNPT